jgi:prepilin-type N-terminal cleavage/methylation domain-containing protein
MRRGFTLVELILAIFILGIGMISVAALFPAGIAQQQASEDEVYGPIVAKHAFDLIRSRVRPEDFGTYEEFTPPGSAVVARDPCPLEQSGPNAASPSGVTQPTTILRPRTSTSRAWSTSSVCSTPGGGRAAPTRRRHSGSRTS